MTGVKARQEKKVRRKKYRANRASMFLVVLVLLVLAGVISVNSIGLRAKAKQHEATQAELQTQIEAEEKRTEEIEDLEDYVGSDAYVEDTAREKLGLVYENEIIFKAQ
ncbi:cell division protein DivIC [Lachnospiraceae bacterium PM6-15]|uniref:Septum formation initiator family protein n=1 Tax=Ohessyouella blattaphilus TaxID=2949333 RepID=A0ABT1EJG5_9FIRM|nr:septum formation initiator family protein [Ohessyouella blattaphilus]MCP1110833.1 septum formation initiator family protein [Ohessyouella blattaphilus]MCR8564227.1 septum formation initiator family protein [Ohessyouella blattaphilus]